MPERDRLGGLFNREATEEPQFDEASLFEIECRQFLERIVEGDDVKGALAAGDERLVESDARLNAAALERATGAGTLDQDLAHGVRGNRAKVRAVLPAVRPVLHQAQIRLMDETGRLKRLPGTLAAKVVGREAPQFLIDDRQQRVEGLPVVGQRQATRSIVTVFMTTGVTGRSCRPVGTEPIFFTTSRPETTSPNTEWRLSRCGVGPSVMKNWLPFVPRTRVGHRQDPGLVVATARVELVAEVVAGAAVALPERISAWIMKP